jgi:transcriptional regulator with XRE-family HTH domain
MDIDEAISPSRTQNAVVHPFRRVPLPDPQEESAQAGKLAPPRTGAAPLPGHRVMPGSKAGELGTPAGEPPLTLARQLNGLLAETLYEERKLSAIPQRILSARTGVPQPKISAYERGRTTPSWETFVRLLLAMERVPVLTTRWTHGAVSHLGGPEDRLFGALLTAVDIVGDRPYLIWHRAAAYLHGLAMTAERVIMQGVAVQVAGDPDRLDDFAQTLGDQCEIRTARGPNTWPHLSVQYDGVDINLFVRKELGPAIEISFSGERFRVPPVGDVLVF